MNKNKLNILLSIIPFYSFRNGAEDRCINEFDFLSAVCDQFIHTDEYRKKLLSIDESEVMVELPRIFLKLLTKSVVNCSDEINKQISISLLIDHYEEEIDRFTKSVEWSLETIKNVEEYIKIGDDGSLLKIFISNNVVNYVKKLFRNQ